MSRTHPYVKNYTHVTIVNLARTVALFTRARWKPKPRRSTLHLEHTHAYCSKRTTILGYALGTPNKTHW